MKPSPESFSGFFFCCGTWDFSSNGKFTTAKEQGVEQNMNYFRSNYNNLTALYLVGGGSLTQSALTNTPDSSFQDAINYGKSLKIDGFIVDFEPDSSSNELATQYGQWLARFQSIAVKNGLNVAMCTATWGILGDYKDYKPANLSYYTSMQTYYGTNMNEDESVVKGELEYFRIDQIRSGIGSMTTPTASRNYNWTSDKLNEFLSYLKQNNVPSVDIWRNDIDYSSGYPTESWFYKDLADFIAS